MGQEVAIDFLIENLNDENNSPVTRHECGEALANFPQYKEKVLPELLKWENCEIPIIQTTCKLAIRKV